MTAIWRLAKVDTMVASGNADEQKYHCEFYRVQMALNRSNNCYFTAINHRIARCNVCLRLSKIVKRIYFLRNHRTRSLIRVKLSISSYFYSITWNRLRYAISRDVNESCLLISVRSFGGNKLPQCLFTCFIHGLTAITEMDFGRILFSLSVDPKVIVVTVKCRG